jgi:hypothetical protein
VSEENVMVFTGIVKPGEGLEPSPGSESDKHFDRLAQELLAKLNAQPDGVLDSETERLARGESKSAQRVRGD